MVGRSPALRRVLERATRVAPTPASVLVNGETGTGKELLARFVHLASGRKGEFVAVNCATLPKDLMESELFGHEKGAFTGAGERRAGLIAQADGGTLFLDEVGEMPLALQVRLLRFLQERTYRPVGSTRERRADVRIVAATWRDLRALVGSGEFREDLYFRLAGYDLVLPPLRERGEDVVLIARRIVAGFADVAGVGKRELADIACAALRAHDWPGNIRELQGVLFRAAIDGDGKRITAGDVRAALPRKAGETKPLEERVLALVAGAGSVSTGEVVRALRVDRVTAWRALDRLVEGGKLTSEGDNRMRRYRVPEVVVEERDPEREAVLALVREHGRVTKRMVMERLGMADRSASRLLADLQRFGALVGSEAGRNRSYRFI
jgi:DNA-binding NtrC family response regulator